MLGIDTARMIALKPETIYFVFTDKGTVEVSYEPKIEIWFVRGMEGEEHPEDSPLHFIGNAQTDGTIFHSQDLPIISTGDRMVFGLMTNKDKGLVLPVYVSGIVKNVVERQEVN
jgi:hypothetical protein